MTAPVIPERPSDAWKAPTIVSLAELAAESGVSMAKAWAALEQAWDHSSFSGGVSVFDGGAVMTSEAAECVRGFLPVSAVTT